MTPEEARKRDMVPAEPFKRLLRERLAEMRDDEGSAHEALGERFGVGIDAISKWLTRCDYFTFDKADKIVIVCTGSPAAWYSDPELNEIYESAA